MPLRRRLLFLISLVLIVCLIGGGVLTYWHGVRKIDLEMSSAINVGETAMEDAIAALAASNDGTHTIGRIVVSFNGDRHLRAKLLAPDGSTVRSSRVRPPSDPAPAWLYDLLVRKPQVVSFDLPGEHKSAGRLSIETDPLNEVSEVWEDMKLKLIIVSAFCSLVLALVYVTVGRALRPLENLATAIGRVAGGDFQAQVSVTGPQELAVIYKQFNEMAEQLAQVEHQNLRLHEQLSTVQEEERAEIARDLHDEIGPFLFAVDVDAQTIPPLLLRGDNEDVRERANAIRQSVGHMQTHLRAILSRLRPATLVDLGLSHAVDQLIAFWKARRPGIVFEMDITEVSFGAALDALAFRIFQEGTSNAVRHGAPNRIVLSARRTENNRLRISVVDNGTGLKATATRGFGLTGMRERVTEKGGSLVITEASGKSGVVLVAELPISPSNPILAHANDDTRAGAA